MRTIFGCGNNVDEGVLERVGGAGVEVTVILGLEGIVTESGAEGFIASGAEIAAGAGDCVLAARFTPRNNRR